MVKRFIYTDRFQPAAQLKDKYGNYVDAPFGSKAYREFWAEQDRRCLHGYEVEGTRITGPHYFMLNFTKLTIVKDVKGHASDKEESWPRFWDLHYDFFHVLEASEKAGKHFVLLKPRGTGFSEIMATLGVYNYTLFRNSKNFYFASNEGFLNKDGIITKCWDKLNFLNKETQRAYKHLRQVKDQDLHKRASYIDQEGDERGYMSEIIARVIDHPRKVRGARTGSRGKVFLEEGGSFPNVRAAVHAIRPLVEQGGVTTGQVVLWGTGGEQGIGIDGLEHIFTHPEGFNMYSFDNIWDDNAIGQKTGWFFPVYACMDRYMDKDGNCDQEAAKLHHDKERARIRKQSPEDEDKYIAEYPYNPNEALMRLTSNEFPVPEAQRQLMKVRTDAGIQGMLKYGWFHKTSGGIKFIIDSKARPIKKWPHDVTSDTTGCITMLESSFKDKDGIVPNNLYSIILDPYYKDEAVESKSLGAAYVYKHANVISDTEDDILVCWYVARPKTLQKFYENLFMMAKAYNAKIQSEIAGGGQGVLDYARMTHQLHLCEYEPDILSTGDMPKKKKNYFMNMSADRANLAISYMGEWLKHVRSMTEDDEKKGFKMVINVDKVYDEGLLEEIIKYNDVSNFDRVSAIRLLPFMIKEQAGREIQQQNNNEDSFWNRELFSDVEHGPSIAMLQSEMMDESMETEFT